MLGGKKRRGEGRERGRQEGEDWFGGMESKPLAAWLGRKDMSIVLGFASIFIHKVEERGKKDVSPLKESALAIGKGVGEGESRTALG